jgi:hypothetical protein
MMGLMNASAISAFGTVLESLKETAERAHEDREDYQRKFESAKGEDIFKYVVLINNKSIELYVSQSRAQAATSFVLSRRVAVGGFLLLTVGVLIGIASAVRGGQMTAAYLAAIGGTITEFISGVFFYLYNRTLQQINHFYDKMIDQQKDALSVLAQAAGVDKGAQLAAARSAPEGGAQLSPPVS